MKPRHASDYDPRVTADVRAACLHLATYLGDLLDQIVIVGGAAPPLVAEPAGNGPTHVGTSDLDLGLGLGILVDERYHLLAERLRHAGFRPDSSAAGNVVRQRWLLETAPEIKVDFLIPPSNEADRPGALRHLEPDFAAIIAPGLALAFLDQVLVQLDGLTLRRESAMRTVRVAGPGAQVAMKALSLRARGENKDAYDLVYVARTCEGGAERIASTLRSFGAHAEAQAAVECLRQDFAEIDSIGPSRVADFRHRSAHEETQVDAWAAVQDILDLLGRS